MVNKYMKSLIVSQVRIELNCGGLCYEYDQEPCIILAYATL